MHKIKSKIDHILEKILIVLETLIAIFSVIVLVGCLLLQIHHIIADPMHLLASENAVTEYLHHMLTIVIGLEFVKLLMHLTPANILEVLTMALSRGIIVNHGSALDNLLSIACIIGLFAAKRYLIPRAELNKEMDEEVPDPSHHRKHRRGNKQNSDAQETAQH